LHTELKAIGFGMNWICRLRARPNRLTSVPDLAEWKQVPAAMFQHLVESLTRRVEAVIAAKGGHLHINAHDFGMRCSTRYWYLLVPRVYSRVAVTHLVFIPCVIVFL
jgi:hypothetical protein